MTEIAPNEELEYYVGLASAEAAADLNDKGVTCRIIVPGDRYEAVHNENRVNLKVDTNGIVIQAYYG